MTTEGSLPEFFNYNRSLERQKLMSEGEGLGRRRATDDYPYAVYRDQASVERVAEQEFQQWFKIVSTEPYYYKLNAPMSQYVADWRAVAQEGKRLFTAAWIASYQATVAKKDEAAKPKVQPQPQPAATSTEATITVTNVKHDGDIHTYWVRIADPRYFDEAQDFPLPLVVDFSEAPASDASTTAASSFSGAFASSSSDVTPLPDYGSKTPQKKKPRLYFGKG